MPEVLTLGGREYKLRPLKLGQLRGVIDALEAMAGKSGGALIEAGAEVVAQGLQPGHPGLQAADLLDVEATVSELNDAVGTIMRVAGLRQNEPGEAMPAAAISEGNSAGSMPLSPPDAASTTAEPTS